MSITPQQEFDSRYITSAALAKELRVSRAAICQAVARGLLPNAIKINDGQITIFLRENVKPFADAWKVILDVKRGTNV